MKLVYASQDGAGPSYEIDADRHGSYTIRYEGTVVKRVTALPNYLGRPKWGSRQLEIDAIEDGKNAIEMFKTEQVRPVS